MNHGNKSSRPRNVNKCFVHCSQQLIVAPLEMWSKLRADILYMGSKRRADILYETTFCCSWVLRKEKYPLNCRKSRTSWSFLRACYKTWNHFKLKSEIVRLVVRFLKLKNLKETSIKVDFQSVLRRVSPDLLWALTWWNVRKKNIDNLWNRVHFWSCKRKLFHMRKIEKT